VFGALQGVPAARLRERVRWALEWTGLAERSRDLVKSYSGGMKRRLNLACGVLHEPRVVLLDEPTVGVDPQSREKIYEMLGGLRAAGTSVLITTHYLEEAEARCERIVIMDRGAALAGGTLPELVASAGLAGRRVRLSLDRPAGAAPAGFTREAGGASVLVTTHYLEEAEARCERIVIMDRGAALAAGTLPELVARAGLAGRRVRIALDRPAAAAPAGFACEADGGVLVAHLDDVAAELPALLARVRDAGLVVRDLDVRSASLQAVFLELTGKELRE
jgi:ABC-type multidrug transport system ATPase subunit